jgi:hypothetical protein
MMYKWIEFGTNACHKKRRSEKRGLGGTAEPAKPGSSSCCGPSNEIFQTTVAPQIDGRFDLYGAGQRTTASSLDEVSILYN